MSDVPAPIETVEGDVANAVPAAVKPEVQAVEDEFNAQLEGAVAGAPAAEADAALTDPGVDQAAKDAVAIAKGGVVPVAQIGHDAQVLVKEVKAGYKTTEFWLTAAVIVLAQLGTLKLPGKYGETITTVLAAASYTLSRGLAK